MTCPFCEEIATGLPPDREGVNVRSRELDRTDSFVVLADISPLVTGHVIIVPRAHLLSFGVIDDVQRSELEQLVARIRAELVATCVEPLVLEHGTDSASDGGGCVSHAHLHLVPAAVDFTAAMAQWRTSEVSSFADLRGYASRDVAYVFVGDYLGRGVVAEGLAGIEKQFLRIEVARQLGIPDPLWDWRRHVLSSNLESTVELFAKARTASR